MPETHVPTVLVETSAMYIRCDNIANGLGDLSPMFAEVPELLCEASVMLWGCFAER